MIAVSELYIIIQGKLKIFEHCFRIEKKKAN